MQESVLGTKIVTQIGFIVKDVEVTSRKFAQFFGVDVPTANWTDDLDKSQSRYHGKPCPAKARLAFFQVGETLAIELIEPDEQPSVWRDFLEENGEGVHHIAFEIKGMKDKQAALTDLGMPVVQTGEYTGGRYAYVDATADLKVLIELLEND